MLTRAFCLTVAGVLIALTISIEAQRGLGGTTTVTMAWQARPRQYLLHMPPNPTGALVLAFHGGGQSAAQQQDVSGFDALADREHFIVAYPEAFERSWADGRNVTAAEQQGIDDVGFAKAVVADIAKTRRIDRARIFATGLSNGGIFVNRLGCEAADTFVAIAAVAAAIAANLADSCHPSSPVAVIGIHGIADPSVPFDGGDVGGRPEGGQVAGSRATQQMWRTLNGCSGRVVTTSLPIAVRAGTSVDRRAYEDCRANADVVWYEIQGGGHRWPSRRAEGVREELAAAENGKSSQNIRASEAIWGFFATHARR